VFLTPLGEGEKGRKGEGEKGRRGDKRLDRYCLPFSLSPFLPLSPLGVSF